MEKPTAAAVEDLRRSRRVSLSIQVSVRGATAPQGSFLSGDVSSHGVFIRIAAPWAVGTRLRLGFMLPKHRWFDVDGEVRWVRVTAKSESGAGIGFVGLKAADALALRDWFEHGRSS